VADVVFIVLAFGFIAATAWCLLVNYWFQKSTTCFLKATEAYIHDDIEKGDKYHKQGEFWQARAKRWAPPIMGLRK
jgi:hypothetical protein